MWQNKGTTYTLVHQQLVEHVLLGGNLLSFRHGLICLLYPSIRFVGATLRLIELVLKRLRNHANVLVPQIRKHERVVVQCHLLLLVIALGITPNHHANASDHRRRNGCRSQRDAQHIINQSLVGQRSDEQRCQIHATIE